MSALIANSGLTHKLLLSEKLKFYAPEYLLKEIGEHKDEIVSKAHISLSEFEIFLALISPCIEIIPKCFFENKILEAASITPDPDDTEYLALALSLNCALWSNDLALRRQDKIVILSTKELLGKIR